MSHRAKNLEYEMQEPAFLRRLRQQQVGGGGPDRYVAPRNKKTAADGDEDAPAYVLEGAEGQTISRKEFEAMTSGKGYVEDDERKEEDSQKPKKLIEEDGDTKITTSRKEEDAGRTINENVTEIGAKGKKRKAVKIGRDDEAEDQEEKIENKKGKSKSGGKPKKRVMKLSFDED